MTALDHIITKYGGAGATSALFTLLDGLPVCCSVKDEELRYVMVNARMQALLGKTCEALIGHTASELFAREFAERVEAREARVLATGAPEEAEETVISPEGREGRYITHLTRTVNAEGRRFVCVTLTEVTELNRAREAAESADRTKSEFLATISHELRTPLNGVLGLAQILRDTDLDDEQRPLVETMQVSGEALLAVISDILDVTSIEAGRVTLNPTVFRVSDAVGEVAAQMTPAAEEKGLRLFLSIAEDAPLVVRTDRDRVKQILSNFVGNALKFTETGHIEIRRGAGADGRLRLSVRDTGIGLSEGQQARVFEKFQQADGSSSRSKQGVGLGLSICRSLARLMRGDVTVESRLGEGSVFTLEVGAQVIEAGPPPPRGIGPLRLIDQYAPRRTALEERLSRCGWCMINDRGAAVTIMTLDAEGLDDEAVAGLEASMHALAPLVLILPMRAPDRQARLTRSAAGLDVSFVTAPASCDALRRALMRWESPERLEGLVSA